MVSLIPAPDARKILPPLLACLPTAFVSPQPPPALLPLLSPILRQRVRLLSPASSQSSETWLSLLSWNPELGSQLVNEIADSDAFELHPVSGEIDVGPIEPISYRRLDEETLQARIVAPELRLDVVCQWCEIEDEEQGSGWRIAEVKPITVAVEDNSWFASVRAAEEASTRQRFNEESQNGRRVLAQRSINGNIVNATAEEDDYWALYDQTPSRSPGNGRSPGPVQARSRRDHEETDSETAYFNRYAQVQPDMDNDDPSPEQEKIGHAEVQGNAQDLHPSGQISRGSLPQPASTSDGEVSRSSGLAGANSHSITSLAIKHHVSASLQNLSDLCRGTGMQKSEFQELIYAELRALSFRDDAQ